MRVVVMGFQVDNLFHTDELQTIVGFSSSLVVYLAYYILGENIK